MTSAVDRMWNIRDAFLLWLYEEAASGNRHPHINIDAIHEAAGWAAEPMTEDEVADATNYLKAEKQIDGPQAWGGGVIRPSITSTGEKQAATGMSVRPGTERPANVTGITNNFNITTHGTANLAVNSSDFTQTITVGEKSQNIVNVADALDQYAAQEPPNATDVRRVASDLRSAASDPDANKVSLRGLLGSAIAAVAIAASTEVGQQVTELAVGTLQSLG
ncbi:serine recombinase [Rhodococcus ruber]|uniref:Serine recombinase n=1 Tax=Rhodococcus ruber TaxID=1830 RepID=A0ABT4MEN7_9NOCA|nr:serine recombinase [Rhodococcus ruber]MCZ4519448.1 serine recombinase [Rhodococcus ruber]